MSQFETPGDSPEPGEGQLPDTPVYSHSLVINKIFNDEKWRVSGVSADFLSSNKRGGGGGGGIREDLQA